MSHLPISADTARNLIRDQIAFTRGLPSPEYVDEIVTRLVQAAMQTDTVGAKYWIGESEYVVPTWSSLPEGHILVEWKLISMLDTERDRAHEADLRAEMRARLEADFGGLTETELLAEIYGDGQEEWEERGPEAPSWDDDDWEDLDD
jgi:hypothetical protein